MNLLTAIDDFERIIKKYERTALNTFSNAIKGVKIKNDQNRD